MSQQVKTSARELIRRSLMLVGVLGEGENPSSDSANDALQTLNEIVDKWNVESLMIVNTVNITIPLNGSKKYTIGPTGDIDTLRPPSGVSLAYYNMPQQDATGPISLPVSLITEGQYNSIALKNLETSIPYCLYYNQAYPIAEVYPYPISNTGEIILTVSDQFLVFNSLDDIIDLPSGYVKALRYNLAVELALEYGRAMPDDVKEIAVGTKSFIKSTNGSQKKVILFSDNALRRRSSSGFNIYSGE